MNSKYRSACFATSFKMYSLLVTIMYFIRKSSKVSKSVRQLGTFLDIWNNLLNIGIMTFRR